MLISKSFKRIKGLDKYYKEIASKLGCNESDLVELDGDGKHINSYFGTNELMFETIYLGLTINEIFIGDISLITDIEGIKYIMEKSRDGVIRIYSDQNKVPILDNKPINIKLIALDYASRITISNPIVDVIKLSKRIEEYLSN